MADSGRGPKDWRPGQSKAGSEAEAEAARLESAVRQAFIHVYGAPRDHGTVFRSIRSSYLPEGKRLEWTEPHVHTVLVLTEHAWVEDPFSSQDDLQKWGAVVDRLVARGWKDAGWDSINSAVHVVFVR